MMAKRGGQRHNLEQIVRKLRDGDAMLNAGKSVAEAVAHPFVSEQTDYRGKNQCGGKQRSHRAVASRKTKGR